MRFVGVVLAAGFSERMGQTKQLLKLHGVTLVEHVVDAALESSLDEVVVVVGSEAPAVINVLADRDISIVENPDPRRGNLSSLLAALDYVDQPMTAVLLLGDMPEVDATVIDHVVATARASEPWAAVTVYTDGVANHPFVLGSEAQQAVRDAAGPKPLWTLLVESPPEPVFQVTVDRSPPLDIDTPEDYVELLRRAASILREDDRRQTNAKGAADDL